MLVSVCFLKYLYRHLFCGFDLRKGLQGEFLNIHLLMTELGFPEVTM